MKRAAGEEGVAREEQRRADEFERDRARGVSGVVDRIHPQLAELDHLGVVEEHVVADIAEHRRVELRDRDLVAGLAHRGDGLDVIPVAVGLEHPRDIESLVPGYVSSSKIH